MTKVCYTCKLEKNETEFCKHGQKKDGLNPSCKSCEAARRKKNYDPNKEKVWARRNYLNNKKNRIKKAREWALNNKEKTKASLGKWQKTNRTKYLESQKVLAKKKAIELAPSYVKSTLKQQGFTEDQLLNNPQLVDLQRFLLQVKRQKRSLNK